MYMGYATLGIASPIYVFNSPSEFTVIKRLMIMDSVGIMLNATMVDIMIAFPRKLSIPSAYPIIALIVVASRTKMIVTTTEFLKNLKKKRLTTAMTRKPIPKIMTTTTKKTIDKEKI